MDNTGYMTADGLIEHDVGMSRLANAVYPDLLNVK